MEELMSILYGCIVVLLYFIFIINWEIVFIFIVYIDEKVEIRDVVMIGLRIFRKGMVVLEIVRFINIYLKNFC